MASREYSLKTVFSCVDKVSGPLKKIGENSKAVSAKLKLVGRAGGNVGRSLTHLKDSVLQPLSAAFALAGASLAGSLHSFADYADDLDAVAQRLGLTAGALQKLQYAAAANGGSANDMNQGLKDLSKTLGMIQSGSGKDAALLFKTLGIDVRGANGKMKNAAELLPQIADAFKNNTNAVTRAAMANTIFGKSGQALIPLLSQGSKAFSEADRRAEEFGLTVSDDAIDAGAKLSATFRDLSLSAKATAGEIVSKLEPVITPIAETVMRWVAANRDLIAQTVAEWVKKIGAAISSVDWGKVIQVGKWLIAAGIAGEVLSIAKSVVQFGVAIHAAFGPWGLLVSAIAAAAVAIYANWDTIVGAVKSGLDSIKGFFTGVWDWIRDVCGKIVDAVAGIIPDWLVKLVSGKPVVTAYGGPAALVAPNSRALGLSASGAVSGRMTIDVNDRAAGKSYTKTTPLTGGIKVSGDAGVIRGDYGDF